MIEKPRNSSAEAVGRRSSLSRATRANLEYLVATLSKRTRGKKYENFVVNYIWSALADESLKPVTQQYVNRRREYGRAGLVDFHREGGTAEDANHALIDLYFPQLHLGVECDEAHHAVQSAADRARTTDIQRAIADYEEIRILVQVDDHGMAIEPVAVVDQLDAAVRRIFERRAEVVSRVFEWAPRGFTDWESGAEDWQLALRQGVLRSTDGYLFRHNGEIKELFGRGDGSGGRRNRYSTSFSPGIEGYQVWLATLATPTTSPGYRATNNSGYVNVILPGDGEVLIGQADPTESSVAARTAAKQLGVKPLPGWEYPKSEEEYVPFAPSPAWDGARRLTFVRAKDALGREGYQFLGVFSPPVGRRESNGIWFHTFRLESDTFVLPAPPR